MPGQRGPPRGELDAELATSLLDARHLIVDELDAGQVEALPLLGRNLGVSVS